jgi:hypothetical protein
MGVLVISLLWSRDQIRGQLLAGLLGRFTRSFFHGWGDRGAFRIGGALSVKLGYPDGMRLPPTVARSGAEVGEGSRFVGLPR